MAFKPESVSDFKSSMSFLIDSMSEAISYLSRGRILASKQSYAVQTEKFSSFFDKVKSDSTLLGNMETKVVVPVFNQHSLSFLNPLVGADGKVDDAFLKVTVTDSEDFKIRTQPDGLFFHISKVFLPVSEVYTEAVKIARENKGDNLPFPNKILLGLYSVVYHSIRSSTPRDQLEIFEENIGVLKESLEVCDEVKPQQSDKGPLGMIKNLLGNIDFNQIGDMMQKVTGDEESSKEFGEVFGKITETIKSGGNPLEAMGDIIKEASMHAAEREDSAKESQQEQEEAVVTEEPTSGVEELE